jgi:hypothetical protein
MEGLWELLNASEETLALIAPTPPRAALAREPFVELLEATGRSVNLLRLALAKAEGRRLAEALINADEPQARTLTHQLAGRAGVCAPPPQRAKAG